MNVPRSALSDYASVSSGRSYDFNQLAARGAPSKRHYADRNYEIAWLGADGRAQFDTMRAPASPVIEAACDHLARGTVVLTEDGPVAVEDLIPGMRVLTSEFGPVILRWVGSFTVNAQEFAASPKPRLLRVMPDAFGLAKPRADVMLSHRAHILMRQGGGEEAESNPAYMPIRAFEDGVQVISVSPVSSVTFFNLAFDRQATINVNGLEVESFHPAPLSAALRDQGMMHGLLRLFPHIRSLHEFGAELIPHLTSYEVERLREAG